MTNKSHGTLYIGVTSDIAARVHQHRNGEGSEFCRKHRLNPLVLIEHYPNIEEAILREKRMKAWKRQWKLRLIRESNSEWNDLYENIHG